jgi:hypothetical protein
MSSKYKIVIAFDLYGTLLSTESIAKELATHFGQDQANKIAALWRRFVSTILLFNKISSIVQISVGVYLENEQHEYVLRPPIFRLSLMLE